MFDPPRSRRAVDQLVRRGVLRGWKIEGASWTTAEAVREYAMSTKRQPKIHDPSTQEAELRRRIDVLESVLAQQEHTITELRIALEAMRQELEEHDPPFSYGKAMLDHMVETGELTAEEAEELRFETEASTPVVDTEG